MEEPRPVSNQIAAPEPGAATRPRRAFGPLRWSVLLAAAAYFATCGLWDPRHELPRVFLGAVVGAAAMYGDVRGCGCGRGRLYCLIALVFFVVGSLANVILAGRSDW